MGPPQPSSAVTLETNEGYVPEIWVGGSQHTNNSKEAQLVHGRNQLIRQQTWYALGVLILVLRHIVRLRTVGVRGYQGDDYLSILVRHLPIPLKVNRSIFHC